MKIEEKKEERKKMHKSMSCWSSTECKKIIFVTSSISPIEFIFAWHGFFSFRSYTSCRYLSSWCCIKCPGIHFTLHGWVFAESVAARARARTFIMCKYPLRVAVPLLRRTKEKAKKCDYRFIFFRFTFSTTQCFFWMALHFCGRTNQRTSASWL